MAVITGRKKNRFILIMLKWFLVISCDLVFGLSPSYKNERQKKEKTPAD